MKLSLLELASSRVGDSISQTIEHSVRYAQAADRLGFERFWLAEIYPAVSTSGLAGRPVPTPLPPGHCAATT